MSVWKAKRFWEIVTIDETTGGYEILLDSRRVTTPAKAKLVVPTCNMAESIAIEWRSQQGEIDPRTMPFTRSANAAIDKVRIQHGEVADLLAAYGDSDLLCYRAATPSELVARQGVCWDPYLDWAADILGVRLQPQIGVMHVAQDAKSIARLRDATHALDAFQLAAFHDLVSLTGSLVLGFAAAYEHQEPSEIWNASRVDENWQIEQWGADEEAEATSSIKRAAFLHAAQFFRACQPA